MCIRLTTGWMNEWMNEFIMMRQTWESVSPKLKSSYELLPN